MYIKAPVKYCIHNASFVCAPETMFYEHKYKVCAQNVITLETQEAISTHNIKRFYKQNVRKLLVCAKCNKLYSYSVRSYVPYS